MVEWRTVAVAFKLEIESSKSTESMLLGNNRATSSNYSLQLALVEQSRSRYAVHLSLIALIARIFNFQLVPTVYSLSPTHGAASHNSGSTLTSSAEISSPEGRIRVRALFDYQPAVDHLNPCPEAGVAFKRGDILLVVDANDQFWWQAKLEADPVGRVGLIPSKQLQEKRIAYQQQQKQQSPGSEKSSVSGGGRRSLAGSRKVRYELLKPSFLDV